MTSTDSLWMFLGRPGALWGARFVKKLTAYHIVALRAPTVSRD
jgi:hypothetical protein